MYNTTRIGLWMCLLAVFGVGCSAPTANSQKGGAGAGAGGVLEARNSTVLGPREEARAMCSVRTLEGNATANVTISRRLHNVVSPRELHTAMQRLELVVHGQLQQLWRVLDDIRASLEPGPAPAPARRRAPAGHTLRYQYYVPSG